MPIPFNFSFFKSSNLTNNLIAYWKMEGNSNDSVNAHNGVDTSITYSTINGKIDKGSYNAGGGTISISHNADLNFTTAFTISFWFKATSNAQFQTYILSKLNAAASDNNWSILYEYVNDTIEFYAGGYSGSAPRTGSGILVSDTNYHHIVYTYDGSTWEGYKDGTNIFSVSKTFSLATGGSNNLWMFTFNGTSNKVNASIDEIGLWNRKITSAEVTELYNNNNGKQYPF